VSKNTVGYWDLDCWSLLMSFWEKTRKKKWARPLKGCEAAPGHLQTCVLRITTVVWKNIIIFSKMAMMAKSSSHRFGKLPHWANSHRSNRIPHSLPTPTDALALTDSKATTQVVASAFWNKLYTFQVAQGLEFLVFRSCSYSFGARASCTWAFCNRQFNEGHK
jgi:hypothetical protein